MRSERTRHYHGEEFFGSLARAINALREAGFEVEAGELRRAAFETGWTSSSEMLGQVGQTLRRVEGRLGGKMPPEAATDLESCIRQSRQAWPTPRLH